MSKLVEQSDGTVNIILKVGESLVLTATRSYDILSPGVNETFTVKKNPTGDVFKNWSGKITPISTTASKLTVITTGLGAREFYYSWKEEDATGIVGPVISGKIIVQP